MYLKQLMLLSLLLLAACGSQLEANLDEASADALSNTLTTSDAYLIDILANPSDFQFAVQDSAAPPAVLLSVLATSGVTPQQAIDCFEEKNPSVDQDGDGVPLAASYEIDCTVTGKDGGFLSLKGSAALSDKDDTNPLSGYRGEINDYTVSAGAASGAEGSLRLDLGVDVTARTPDYRIAYSVELAATGENGDGSISYSYDAGYRPDDVDDPFSAGTFSYDGDLSFVGEDGRYSLTAFTDDLHYSESCLEGFDAGTRTFEDSNGARLVITNSSCGSVTVEFSAGS